MGFAGYESNVSRIALLKVKIVTKIKEQFSIIERERLKVFINYLRVFPRVPPMFIFSLHIFFPFSWECRFTRNIKSALAERIVLTKNVQFYPYI